MHSNLPTSDERIVHPILGRLPAGWRAEKLKDLCKYLQRGKAPTYVEDSEVVALNQKAIRWGAIEEEHLKHHDPDVPIAEPHFIRKGDVVVNSTGDITIGRAYLFKEAPARMFADSHVTIVRTDPEKLKPEYLVNLLATPEYQDLIYSMVTGSTGQLELNKSNLERLPILYPPMDLQARLCNLWEPLYQSICLSDALRRQCENAIRLLLDRETLNAWKKARWEQCDVSSEGKRT
ncbi:MAG: restriction endonuclease subunit S [Armatimonadetes bacterium]|nr:restriction endonuclease subunit S [Armatimonadota bacterium]